MNHDAPLRMLAGLGVGLMLGLFAHAFAGDAGWLQSLLANLLDPAGKIFLGLFFMLMIPLIASSLAIAVSEFGDVRALGRVGAKTFAYTLAVSTIAVRIGVGLVNALQPGAGLQNLKVLVRDTGIQAAQQSSGIEFVVNLVPRNVMKSMVDGDMLAVMVFALFLGAGIAITRTSAARQFEGTLRGLYDVVMNLIGLVLRLAPFGVACLVFSITARLGSEALQLWRYVAIVVLALALHQFVVYSLSVCAVRRHESRALLPRRARADAHRILHRVERRDAPDRADRRRRRAPPAVAREPLRPHARLDRESEWHRAVRGRHRALSRADLRHPALARAADHGRVHLHSRRHRHRWRARRFAARDRDDPRPDRHPRRRDRHRLRRRSLPRHVPDHA